MEKKSYMKKYKIAVYPLYKYDSAYFEITRKCMEDPDVQLIDFSQIGFRFWKYKNINAVFLNLYEDIKSEAPFRRVKLLIKFFLKIISVYMLKINKIKIVYYIHNREPHDAEEKWMVNCISNLLIKKADYIIMLCHETEQFLLEKRNGESYIKNALYIPHPEYSSVYAFNKDINFRESLGICDDVFVVLLFGMIRPYKNIEVWLEAAKKLRDKNIIFLLAGDGIDKNYVNKISDLCSEIKNVIFINRFIDNSEVASLYNAADVLTLPYEKGSLNSGPVMAALTFGVPVISPDIGTLHDYSQEYFTVYDYVNVNDHINKLTEAILNSYIKFLSMSPDKRLVLRKKMIHEVKKNASFEVVKRKYISLYSDLFSHSKNG